jgi:hypothetical protein
MKKILVLMVVLMVGLMAFSIPVTAQTASIAGEGMTAVIPSLSIKAPLVGGAGEEVKIKVVELPAGTPAVGAGVWAVDINKGVDLTSVSSSELDQIGVFLGWTGNSGEVVHIFQATGKYLLLAFKDGYLPAFTWIKIQPLKVMAIKGPATALPGQTCEFTVYEPENGAAVSGAGVWALRVQDEASLISTEDDLAPVIVSKGIFLGWTNNLGQVFHAFVEPGPYLLAATHQGYKPAFSKILIQELKELAIRAPETVNVLEPFSLRVVEKSVLTVEIPVAKAGVWAITSINTLNSLTNQEAVAKYGIFLGWTNEEGYISPKPYFKEVGKFWLVAFKDGYVPGISQIKVNPLKEMAIKGPETALVGQTCEFTVYETGSGLPVSGAGVWACLNQAPSILSSTENDLVSSITARGIFLGRTNSLGQVFYAFADAGSYRLLATQQGYKPAFSKIAIQAVKELAIIAPEIVKVLQTVNIRIVEKSGLPVEIPVSKAAVWAVSAASKANLDDVADFAVLVKSQGIFLGWTNTTGYVTPKPRFSQTGQYWLIAIKDGYAPGVDTITVITPVPLAKTAKTAIVK